MTGPASLDWRSRTSPRGPGSPARKGGGKAERGAHLFIGPAGADLEVTPSLSSDRRENQMGSFRGVRSRLGSVDRAMAQTHLAVTTSTHAPSKSKKRRSRGITRDAPASVARGNGTDWSDLEQAFFAAAPPDEPEPAAELECFDDLLAPERREPLAALGQAAATAWGAFRRLLFGPSRGSRPASPR